MNNHNYATIAILGALLKLSKSTQWRMRNDGRLKFYRVGRGIRYKLEEVLESFKMQ